jgi:outer membrane protein, protease secretion system
LAEAAELEADNARLNALATLQAVINKEPDQLAALDPKKLPAVELEPVETIIAKAEAANPNLEALRYEQASAEEEIGKARAGHFPTLDFIASHRRANNELETSLNRKYYTNLGGLQLSVPLFSGGFVHASVLQAKARMERAKERAEAGRREIALNVRKEYGSVRLNAARVAALIKAVASVEQALSGTEKGVTAGTRTTIDVLNAQDLVYRTRVELAKASYLFVMSELRLRDAAGSLDEAALKRVNDWLEKP